MTLNDVLKAGKAEAKFEKLNEDFDEDQSINAWLYITQITGQHRNLVNRGMDPRIHGAGAPATFHRDRLEVGYERSKLTLAAAVQANYTETVNALGTEDRGRVVISELLSEVRPKNYGGVSADILRAHKALYKSYLIKENPEAGYNDLVASLTDPTIQEGVVMLKALNPKLPEAIAEEGFNRALQTMDQATGNIGNARTYLNSLYNAITDAGQKADVAHRIGKAATKVNVNPRQIRYR